MKTSRREFMEAVGSVAAGSLVLGAAGAGQPAGAAPATERSSGRIEAVAFDGFTLLDFRALPQAAERLFPGQGARFEEVWRTRLFDYGWLRVLGGQYRDFEGLSPDAFDFTALLLKLDPTAAARREYLDTLLALQPWPEAAEVLSGLRSAGLKLAFLSNFTPAMLATIGRRTGLDKLMDPPLSTDAVRSYKPDPKAYQLGVRAFGVPKERVAFVAHGGWDAAGASWFGFRTYWINRTGIPLDGLGATPIATLASLAPLQSLVSRG